MAYEGQLPMSKGFPFGGLLIFENSSNVWCFWKWNSRDSFEIIQATKKGRNI